MVAGHSQLATPARLEEKYDVSADKVRVVSKSRPTVHILARKEQDSIRIGLKVQDIDGMVSSG